MKQKYLLGAIVAIQSTMLASAGLASTLTTDETENYLAIILDGDDEREFGSGSGSSSEGDVLQSAWGRVHRELDDNNGNVTPSNTGIADPVAPAQELPQTSDPSVSTFGGNIAVLDDDVDVNFSNVDLYAQEGAGVDCVDACFSESSTSNSNYFIPDTPDGTDAYGREFEIGDGGSDVSALDTGIGTRESAIGVSSPTEARGVNENQDLSALQAEVSTTFDVLKNLESTSTLWTHEWTLSDGKIDNFAPDQGEAQDYVLSDQLGGSLLGVNGTGNEFTDLNIIYINTNGNDFSIGNSNFILDGQEGQDFIFLLNSGQNFLVTQSKLLVGPELDLFSALWFVSGDEKRTIDFSQSESNGFSFWNHSPESVIQANNYRACGQWVAENIQDWNNFSVDRCAYSNASPPPPEVPLPASFPLILSGLFGLGLMARRR